MQKADVGDGCQDNLAFALSPNELLSERRDNCVPIRPEGGKLRG